LGKAVYIKRQVLDSLLSYARSLHPREGILLLRGKRRGDGWVVEEVVIPPLATYGYGFSAFPLSLLPIDFSIIGTAHSHPSGHLAPSNTDLNHFFGYILVIVAPPYESERDVAAFDHEGRRIPLGVVHEP